VGVRRALYGPRPEADERYLTGVLRGTWGLTDDDVRRLLGVRRQVAPFLAARVAELAAGDHTFVGLTSVFHQNVPSLALARLLKAARPDVTIAFGGANWEEEMGAALLERFGFVDLAFSGEADRSFPAVLEARRQGPAGRRHPRRPAAVRGRGHRPRRRDHGPGPGRGPRARLRAVLPAAARPPRDRRRLPHPAGRDVARLLVGSPLALHVLRPQRRDDGVPQQDPGPRRPRARRPAGALRRPHVQRRRRHPRLPVLRHRAPPAGRRGLDVELFWEVKANLSRDQVRTLSDAGVRFVQPGVESLSDHVLALMRKGTTGLRNIELLKWCREYGVKPLWNLLYGFPGETEDDYLETVHLIQAIWHLDPPTGYGPVRLDRFSPYHDDPGGFGMTNVRPMAPFATLYPFDADTVRRIAYYFDYDYADGRRDDVHARPAVDLAVGWMNDAERGDLVITPDGDGVRIVDSRRGLPAPRRARLTGWKAEVYEKCDRSQRFDTLAACPASAPPG
jgi:hypothetical protein